jgi:hypothetical protein
MSHFSTGRGIETFWEWVQGYECKQGMRQRMSDNVAVMEGYTREVIAMGDGMDLYLLVKPDTDFDSAFRAWDTDNQEFIRVNGWLFVVTENR